MPFELPVISAVRPVSFRSMAFLPDASALA
jgi:hypothetical protein